MKQSKLKSLKQSGKRQVKHLKQSGEAGRPASLDGRNGPGGYDLNGEISVVQLPDGAIAGSTRTGKDTIARPDSKGRKTARK